MLRSEFQPELLDALEERKRRLGMPAGELYATETR